MDGHRVTASELSERILSGTAPKTMVEGCLVLEGGAFRGLHTQGFLDVMMQEGLNLSCVIGVSAGALAGVNYVAGQIGRSARTNLLFRHDSRYVGLRALLHSHSILDVGFLTEDRGILEPLDWERFSHSAQRFVAVATNVQTGKATYFEKGKCDILLAARASGTMPFLSPPVRIDSIPYLDGGCSCKIPYAWALEQGYEKIIVVRTREAGFRVGARRHPLARWTYHAYPAFADALDRSDEAYDEQCDELEQLHAAGRLLHITPSKPICVDIVEKDIEKLAELYAQGCADCRALLPKLREYLQ